MNRAPMELPIVTTQVVVSGVLQKQIWVMMFQGNQPLPGGGAQGNIDDPEKE